VNFHFLLAVGSNKPRPAASYAALIAEALAPSPLNLGSISEKILAVHPKCRQFPLESFQNCLLHTLATTSCFARDGATWQLDAPTKQLVLSEGPAILNTDAWKHRSVAPPAPTIFEEEILIGGSVPCAPPAAPPPQPQPTVAILQAAPVAAVPVPAPPIVVAGAVTETHADSEEDEAELEIAEDD